MTSQTLPRTGTETDPATATTTPDVRTPAPGIGFPALVRVELVKMFNTRSGSWLVASIGILAVLAAGGVLVFGGESAVSYANFSGAVGIPTAVILPVLAVLAVTSEYSQRTGLTTYTLVPHRSKVIAAKFAATIGVGVVSILAAMGIAALGNLLGAAVHDLTPVWEFSAGQLGTIVLANVIGMLMGFTLGVLLRNSPAAIVAYFVYSLILPNVFGTLAYFQPSFADVWPWIDFFYNTTGLFEVVPDAEGWAKLAVSGTLWLLAPLALGLRMLVRSEVK